MFSFFISPFTVQISEARKVGLAHEVAEAVSTAVGSITVQVRGNHRERQPSILSGYRQRGILLELTLVWSCHLPNALMCG